MGMNCIMPFIIFCWVSCGALGSRLGMAMRFWMNWNRPESTGKMYSGSGAARLGIHRNGDWPKLAYGAHAGFHSMVCSCAGSGWRVNCRAAKSPKKIGS